MTLALDSSVLVRLLIGEPADQFGVARRRLDVAHADGERVMVSDLVLAETYYALRHHYRVPEEVVRARLVEMLRSGLLESDPPGLVATLEYSSGEPGLVDRLIHRKSRDQQALLITFDRRQAKLPDTELLG